MKEIFKFKAFWLALAASCAVIFTAALNLNQSFRSETDLLVIPKSATAVENSDQIIGNLLQIPRTLTFFNKMNQENPDTLKENVAELPDNKRKDYWNSKIKIERAGESGILKFTAFDKDRYLAQTLGEQAAKTLIASAGLYYDIRNDIDIRIIDGPVTGYFSLYPDWFLFLASIAASFAIVFLSFWLSFFIFRKKENASSWSRPFWTPQNSPKLEGLQKFQKEVKLQPESEKQEKREVEEKKPVVHKEESWTAAEEPYVAFTKKATAPDNLPIAENFPEFTEDHSIPKSQNNKSIHIPEEKTEQEEPAEAEVKITPEPEEEKPIIREATPEEVKERLNKLLSGKL